MCNIFAPVAQLNFCGFLFSMCLLLKICLNLILLITCFMLSLDMIAPFHQSNDYYEIFAG